MWSLVLTITVMGTASEYHLPGYYDSDKDCEAAIARIMKRSEVRAVVEEATIECVEGWRVNLTKEAE